MIHRAPLITSGLAAATLMAAFLAEAMEVSVHGDKHQYVSGSFTVKDTSDPPSPAIGVEQVRITLEYRVPRGGDWEAMPVPATCTPTPAAPFVFSGSQTLSYDCTANPEDIPDAASAVLVTACVEVFERDTALCRRKGFSFAGTSSPGVTVPPGAGRISLRPTYLPYPLYSTHPPPGSRDRSSPRNGTR